MDPLTTIYAVTIVISVIVALLLARLAQLTSQAKVKALKEKKEELSDSGVLSGENLDDAIFRRVNEVIGSKQRCKEVSRAVSGIFDKELSRRVDLSSKKVDERYKAIIEEKNQSQEMAWKKYKKVLSDKKETEAVIRSVAEGLLVVDANGKVLMMNPAAEQLLGTTKRDKIGRPVLENLKKEQLVSLTKESPEGGGREIEIVSDDDETKKILRSSTAVIENKDGQTVGMVSVLSDITKQKELDRLKSKFVANVTHELRTPLIAIQKSISLLLGKTTGEISETQEEFLSLAERNLKKLGVLIDDLLDLSKLEAGRMELKQERTSVERLVNESVENISAWARTKSIRLEKKVQEGMPEIEIDPKRIGQVLNNLLGNAIKFTPDNGKVSVDAFLNKDADEIQVSVADNGVDIPKEDLDKIFQRFYQTGERTPTDISGTGVGLSLAKEIVELYGGRIWAESEKGQGAKFIFTLPINTPSG